MAVVTEAEARQAVHWLLSHKYECLLPDQVLGIAYASQTLTGRELKQAVATILAHLPYGTGKPASQARATLTTYLGGLVTTPQPCRAAPSSQGAKP